MTFELEKKISLLYKNGMNDAAIGRQVGYTTGAIYQWRRRNALPPNKNKLNPKHIRRMKLYEQGKSDPEIAAAEGVTASAIYAWRKVNGLPFNPTVHVVDRELGRAMKYFREEGRLSQRELGKKLGVTQGAVSAWENGYCSMPEKIEKLVRGWMVGHRFDNGKGN